MINLTEKLKKGELPNGEYWCLSICGDIDKLYCYQNSFWKYKTEDDYYGVPVEIKQVLALVPSYDEWIEKTKSLKVLAEAYCKEKQQNTKLKELLKGAREVLKMVDTYSGDYDSINGFLIVEEINQVLGE